MAKRQLNECRARAFAHWFLQSRSEDQDFICTPVEKLCVNVNVNVWFLTRYSIR